jgi:hypothetical protein
MERRRNDVRTQTAELTAPEDRQVLDRVSTTRIVGGTGVRRGGGLRRVARLARCHRSTAHPRTAAIAGLIAFYDEEVDLEVDGEVWERPVTRFA